MNIPISSFPILTQEQLKAIDASCEITKMSYKVSLKTSPLKFSVKDSLPQGNSYIVSDASDIWHPNDNNLDVQVSINIGNTGALFGTNGIANSNSTLGLAVLWKDKESCIQDTQIISSFTKNNKSVGTTTTISLPAGILRGVLVIEFIIYLVDAGTPIVSEGYFATEQGTILGDIAEHMLIIEGNGSVFPISETEGPIEDPLWWVEYNSEDPTIDSFTTDNFCIYINKSNPAYVCLKTHEDDYNHDMFIEILASAFQILISNFNKWVQENDYSAGEDNYADGSIGRQIVYFKSIFDLHYDVSSPQIMAKDIRKALQKSFNYN